MIAHFLAAEVDRLVLIEGLRNNRRIYVEHPMTRHVSWGKRPVSDAETDAQLLGSIRANPPSMYHLAGTCSVVEDPGAVVDTWLRGRGLEGLRVVASVMLSSLFGNTIAPTMVIVEKASDMSLVDAST